MNSTSKAPVLSKTLKKDGNYGKNGRKGYDTMITRLQKQCYQVGGVMPVTESMYDEMEKQSEQDAEIISKMPFPGLSGVVSKSIEKANKKRFFKRINRRQ